VKDRQSGALISRCKAKSFGRKTRLWVFSRNERCSQGRTRAECDNRAIVNQLLQSDSAALAEWRQRCDKADATPQNDPKREEIFKATLRNHDFRGIFGNAKFA
jgi:hypothetical protein